MRRTIGCRKKRSATNGRDHHLRLTGGMTAGALAAMQTLTESNKLNAANKTNGLNHNESSISGNVMNM